jgi:hypothetical protein
MKHRIQENMLRDTRGATQITSISTHDGGRGSREMAKFHPTWMRYWIQIHMCSNYRKTIWYEYSWQTCKFRRESAKYIYFVRQNGPAMRSWLSLSRWAYCPLRAGGGASTTVTRPLQNTRYKLCIHNKNNRYKRFTIIYKITFINKWFAMKPTHPY